MRKSNISIEVELDTQSIPEKIYWDADDKPGDKEETKAVAINIWDSQSNSIMKLDLWTKDMMVGDMKRFVIQILGGLSETIGSATDDQYMAQKMGALAEEFAQRLLEEENKQGMR